ncbi:hypothetical protein Tco_0437932 [Tanacetum coccineum]
MSGLPGYSGCSAYMRVNERSSKAAQGHKTESEVTSGSDSDCDLHSCNDFSPINIPDGKSVTFSNPLFDSNDDFTSSDDESLSDEDVTEDNVKIYLNLLFEFDDEYISSDVNHLFDEVLENIENKESYASNFGEPTLLVTPLFDANEDACFNPGGEIDKIDAFLGMDISTDIEDGYHDSEGDMICLKSLLIKDTIPNLPPKAFLDHDPRSLMDEPDNDELKSMVKVFDLGIHEEMISLTYVRSPVLWDKIGESSLIGPELVQETIDKVVLIKEKLKAARDRQKSYADNRCKPLEFEVGDWVMLKVSPWKGVIRFGKKGKLAPRYIKVDKTLRFVEELVEIIDREIKSLKRSTISLVKVRWNSKRGPEFTWEREDYMKFKYP